MTCIVGLSVDGQVYMGGDSAAVANYERRASALPKVFRRGKMLIGYTSSFRMGQLLQHTIAIPEHTEFSGIDYMVCKFVEEVRKVFREYGYTKIEGNVESGGSFMVGLNGRLYCIEEDFQVQQYQDGVGAVGCGWSYALGAMMALTHLEPMERIQRSLEISAYFSAGVMAPFTVLRG